MRQRDYRSQDKPTSSGLMKRVNHLENSLRVLKTLQLLLNRFILFDTQLALAICLLMDSPVNKERNNTQLMHICIACLHYKTAKLNILLKQTDAFY